MKQRKSLQVAERDHELLQRIQELKAQLKPWDFDRPWGYHRVWVYLRNNGCVVSKKRVLRLMRDYHLFADFRGPRWRWYTATLNPLLLETAEEFQQAYQARKGRSPSIKVPGSTVWVRGEPGNSWFYVMSRGYGKPDGNDSHAPLMDQQAAWQLHCQHHHRQGMCDKGPEAAAVHQAILALDKKALPGSLQAGESTPQAAGTPRFFTRPEAKAKIGTPVRSLVEFAGVPCGTLGQVIDEHLAEPLARPRGYKVGIEWDLPRSQWKSVPGGSRPWIDWFDRREYVCSLAEVLVRDPYPN